jgi:hypothetical protein
VGYVLGYLEIESEAYPKPAIACRLQVEHVESDRNRDFVAAANEQQVSLMSRSRSMTGLLPLTADLLEP